MLGNIFNLPDMQKLKAERIFSKSRNKLEPQKKNQVKWIYSIKVQGNDHKDDQRTWEKNE